MVACFDRQSEGRPKKNFIGAEAVIGGSERSQCFSWASSKEIDLSGKTLTSPLPLVQIGQS